MKTKNIIANTRTAIINTIIDCVLKIDAFLNTGDKRLKTDKGEEVILDAYRFPIDRIPSIDVEVEDTYTDEYYNEERHITEISISESGELCISAKSEFSDYSDEVYLEDISTDDLARIAEFLEKEYEKM